MLPPAITKSIFMVQPSFLISFRSQLKLRSSITRVLCKSFKGCIWRDRRFCSLERIELDLGCFIEIQVSRTLALRLNLVLLHHRPRAILMRNTPILSHRSYPTMEKKAALVLLAKETSTGVPPVEVIRLSFPSIAIFLK